MDTQCVRNFAIGTITLEVALDQLLLGVCLHHTVRHRSTSVSALLPGFLFLRQRVTAGCPLDPVDVTRAAVVPWKKGENSQAFNPCSLVTTASRCWV